MSDLIKMAVYIGCLAAFILVLAQVFGFLRRRS
jgi:hypothetical protein